MWRRCCSGAYAPASALIMSPIPSLPHSGMIVLKHRNNKQALETSASTTQSFIYETRLTAGQARLQRHA